MNRMNPVVIGLVGFAVGAGVMFAARSSPLAPAENAAKESSKEPAKGKASQPTGEQVTLYKIPNVAAGTIETVPIRKHVLEETMIVNGRVAPNPNRIARVSSLVSGRVAKSLANIGAHVRAGQTLAIIESADAAKAYAAHEQAKSGLAIAEEELRNTQRLAAAGMFTQKAVDEVQRERAQVASELAAMRVAHEHESSAADSEVKTTQAVLARAESTRDLARAELARRKTLVELGAVQYKPLEEARREMAEARATAITAEANLVAAESQARRTERLQTLGTASQREVETARAAHSESKASLERAKARVEIALQALAREQKVFELKIYATRELESGDSDLKKAEREVQEKQADRDQAFRRLELAKSSHKQASLKEMENRLGSLDAMLKRETSVSKQNLLAERALYEKSSAVARAKIELQAASHAARLFKARPVAGGTVGIPIVAPISGVVVERPAQIGQTVDPTTALFTILDNSNVWIELEVYEKDIPKIHTGQAVRVFSSEIPAMDKTARIVQVGSTVDPQTRTARVRAEVAGGGIFKPGMFVKGEITVGSGKESLIVPREAVVDEPAGKFVYIKWPDNQGWEHHAIQSLATNARYAAIKGPAAGEQVATKGVSLVQAAVKAQMAGGGGSATAHTHEH